MSAHYNLKRQALAAADMGAWAGHGLYPPLLAGLAAQGFTTPTPVQEACLPAAVHGRRDIIGAAQTVRAARLSQHLFGGMCWGNIPRISRVSMECRHVGGRPGVSEERG